METGCEAGLGGGGVVAKEEAEIQGKVWEEGKDRENGVGVGWARGREGNEGSTVGEVAREGKCWGGAVL